jgi:FkbM family methyltransferase
MAASVKRLWKGLQARLTPRLRPLDKDVGCYSYGKLTREQVAWAYRLFLDREPESEEVISAKLSAWSTTKELRIDIMSSPEFRLHNPALALTNDRNIVIKELDCQLRLFIDLSDHAIGMNIIRGRYEQDEIKFAKEHLMEGHTAIDIGANIGFFTVTMASLVGSSGKVYAFEPLDSNADLLEHSIIENSFADRVVLERAAAGGFSGSAQLLFPTSTLNSGGAYLFQEGMEAPGGHETRAIPLIALDDYVFRRPVRFIKMDVEGAEPLVLRGATKILQQDRPLILSELHPLQLEKVSRCTPAQFVSAMRGYGYECYMLEHGELGGKIANEQFSALRSVVFLPE